VARVLFIDAEADLDAPPSIQLTEAGHRVTVASTAAEGVRQARDASPDIVLLEMVLPDAPGTNVCRALRDDPATRRIPVFFLTSRGAEVDRVVAFELGADDYVVKPFSVRELLLRVDAVLRRGRRGQSEVQRFGELCVDLASQTVTVADEPVELTALEFRLLVTLLERRDRVQSRARLLGDVWGMPEDSLSRTVDTHVKRLRDKLGPAARFIDTVRRVGYRFTEAPNERE
jgi:two-component system phosphate regulon response regulator PhoB